MYRSAEDVFRAIALTLPWPLVGAAAGHLRGRRARDAEDARMASVAARGDPFGLGVVPAERPLVGQGMQSTGTVDVRSRHSGRETIDRLESLAKTRGLTVFARIDFSGDAERAGLSMRPMQMLLFGNPKAGTPLLLASPRSGLDLPLRALAWEDADGAVWVSSNSPDYLASRHGLTAELIARIAGVGALIEAAAAAEGA
jgi:uncharacterized protein (DUF302 family)